MVGIVIQFYVYEKSVAGRVMCHSMPDTTEPERQLVEKCLTKKSKESQIEDLLRYSVMMLTIFAMV